MSKQPKNPKPVKMWAVKLKGTVYTGVFAPTRKLAQEWYEDWCNCSWRWAYSRGVRCVRITIIPGEADPNGWRPIETAPKDGTDVQLWCKNVVVNAQAALQGYYGPVTRNWRIFDGERHVLASTLQLTPTHWRPLDGPENTK